MRVVTQLKKELTESVRKNKIYMDAILILLSVVKAAQDQWGSDYLWEKQGLNEDIKRASKLINEAGSKPQ